ncbi:penicillin-binding transpeptidase domain-containing protein [Winogradskya consettensis]|uniref:Cell division protein FtsI n=1 Tax=Winogradskya consettensis TaxID=113560 RepID=A0A919SC50_9ACTN|nr:penicillin-binding transpeptidase domain-containing protein [Actinoplanes consettensis]GIM68929.1 cell division protein FtsI [Actinoplanes consettensis]
MPTIPHARRALAVLTCLVVAGTGTVACSGSDGPGDTVDAFLQGWRKSDLSKVGFVTAAGAKIAATDVTTQLKALTGDLAPSLTKLEPAGKATESGKNATEPINLAWTLPGGATWAYQSTVRLTKQSSDGWQVVWEPAIVHTKLTEGDSLKVRAKAADRGDILDAAGKPLVTPTPVVTIGISPEKVTDQAKLLKDLNAAFKAIGVTLDEKDLTTRLKNSDPTAFVDVVTLRRPDYDKVRTKVRTLPGTVFREENRELAPTRAFARALLGTVDAATREDLDANPGTLTQGDMVGHGGLQERYDTQLRGTAAQTVVIALKTPADDVDETQIFSTDPVAGKSIKTTLDVNTQKAADAAVAAEKNASALVAIKISDSTILAVSNGPDGGAVNTALTGQVPPGSTFKMVSTLGLLDKKAVTLDGKVDCPATVKVSGREFKNSHEMKLGQVPFRTDFAKSCNTAFVNVSGKLGADGLQAAGTALGIGTKWDLGVDAFSGKLSPADTPTELAAATFGQGATAVSPLAMAGATAAVARGQFKQPKLVLDPAPAAALPDGAKLADTSIQPLKTMMREVVTKGTGDALQKVPGGPVSGKTGTAEFADGSDETHSWFIGWQGDIAFAVMVQKGGLGSEAAVPIVNRFLTTLNK